MPGSYERINYGLRPAKCIERKMMCEAFRRLSEFGSIESYRYIGFGSTYFSDFSLFHKHLGITNMISMEQDEANKARFEFNRPFNCIDIRYGHSNQILPAIVWDTRTILWLDYDGELNDTVLTDVQFFCMNAIPGSVLVVSANAELGRYGPDRSNSECLRLLKERVGDEKVPLDVAENGLEGWRTAHVYWRICTNQIAETLQERNGGRMPGSKLLHKQIFNFHYADGAKILTIGVVIYDEGQRPIIAKCAFGDLPFVRTGAEECRIVVPNLTYREIRHLDRQLPCDSEETELDAAAVPTKDLKNYQKLYSSTMSHLAIVWYN